MAKFKFGGGMFRGVVPKLGINSKTFYGPGISKGDIMPDLSAYSFGRRRRRGSRRRRGW